MEPGGLPAQGLGTVALSQGCPPVRDRTGGAQGGSRTPSPPWQQDGARKSSGKLRTRLQASLEVGWRGWLIPKPAALAEQGTLQDMSQPLLPGK